MLRFVRSFFLGVGLSIGFQAVADGASSVVTTLQQALMESASKADQLGFDGRYDLIFPAIEQTHDFDHIARLVTGRHWRKLQEEQKQKFIATFKQLSAATYADRFSQFQGERFTLTGSESQPRDIERVSSTLTLNDGKILEFEYMLHQQKGQWRIINIVVDGVSDLALRRAEYARILKDQGFEALIQNLNTQIDRLGNSNV